MRFALRLFSIPVMCIILAFLLNGAAGTFGENPHLYALVPYLNYVGLGLIFIALSFLAYNAWRVWQAWRGVGELCYVCGMPTTRKEGRYGPYFKCWNCDTNRANQ